MNKVHRSKVDAWLGIVLSGITDTSLRIRSGLFRWEIPIQDISKVESTTDPVSSPALSLDRIRLEDGQAKSVLISPVNKEAFLRDLRQLGVPRA